jgi:hypothetical protein
MAGETALMFAATFVSKKAPENARTIVKLLVDAGADVTAVDALGETVLHKAYLAHASTVVALLKSVKGIDLEAKNKEGQTPVEKADALRKLLLAEEAASKRGQTEEEKVHEQELAGARLCLLVCMEPHRPWSSQSCT